MSCHLFFMSLFAYWRDKLQEKSFCGSVERRAVVIKFLMDNQSVFLSVCNCVACGLPPVPCRFKGEHQLRLSELPGGWPGGEALTVPEIDFVQLMVRDAPRKRSRSKPRCVLLSSCVLPHASMSVAVKG